MAHFLCHLGAHILEPFCSISILPKTLKGREKEDTKVDVTFIVKRDGEEKNIRYSGDAKVFKDAFEKIDLNKM